jgi:hypothetical protein
MPARDGRLYEVYRAMSADDCPVTILAPGGHPQRPAAKRPAVAGFNLGWARVVSNHRPLACEASALPLSYAPYGRILLVRATRCRLRLYAIPLVRLGW